ncbi:MAG: triose-phosphate isomerase [Fidelibacterota bacterium]|nr:MAG: triose-phosphate isomerase [Candidatus Neomarinimicrobiota bacterium]
MSDRKPIIAANWKMFKTPTEGYQFARQLLPKAMNLPGVKFILCPSATGLYHIQEVVKDSAIELGGQNLHPAEEGAFTGETSARMLVACGCQWVIIGHSERRHIFHESDKDIQPKIPTALNAGLNVILCIGERLEERQEGKTEEVLRQQLRDGLAGMETYPIDRLVIAYEPVWAIGTGVVATPEQAGEAHAQVRGILGELFPGIEAETVGILYGGSVKSSNAEALSKTPGIDGFLIGGASLDLDEYVKIAEISQIEA